MPTIADLRGAYRETLVTTYAAAATTADSWTAPSTPNAAGTGAGVVPTSYLSDLGPLGTDGYLVGHEFTGAGTRISARLVDLLWVGPSIALTSTGTTTLGSVTLPARDDLGGTDGYGVQFAFVVVSTVSAGWAVTLAYTNQAGSSGRSTGVTGGAASQANVVRYLGLQGSDSGIQSVQSLTVDTSVAGGIVRPVMVRILSTVPNRDNAAVQGSRSTAPQRTSALGVQGVPLYAGTLLMPHYATPTGSTVQVTHVVKVAHV